MTYALGNTEEEQRRLARQAERFDPILERLFLAAGIARGQRVLDLGSGAGDVAILLSRLVGPSGAVVGVERNADSLAWATERVRGLRIANVTFVQADVDRIPPGEPFDGAVGRFILMFLPDPAAALRTIARSVRPGGCIAFLEPWWRPYVTAFPDLPLWSATVALIHEAFRRSGARTNMGIELRAAFEDARLPTPRVHLEMPLGGDRSTIAWVRDVLKSLLGDERSRDEAAAVVGDLATLERRLDAEVEASRAIVGWPPVVGAWVRR
jgi:SAM-dependent methyltransferase